MKIPAFKPIHGWRTFWGEVGIIVVGVLIALAAQQFVDDRSWRGQVAESRASLDKQLVESKYASVERISLHDCNEKKLDFLDEVIAGKRPATNLKIALGSLRLRSTSAWDSATASGAVAHMPADIRDNYASLFAFTEAMRELNMREFEVANDLSTLERHSQLTDVSRDRLARDIATLRALAAMMKLGGEQWLDGAKPLHLQFNETDMADVRKNVAKSTTCTLPDGSKVQTGAPAR